MHLVGSYYAKIPCLINICDIKSLSYLELLKIFVSKIIQTCTGEAGTSSNATNSYMVGACFESVTVRYVLTDPSGNVPQHSSSTSFQIHQSNNIQSFNFINIYIYPELLTVSLNRTQINKCI